MKTPPKPLTTLRWLLLIVAVLLATVVFYGPHAWALAVPVLALAAVVARGRRRRARRRAARRPKPGGDGGPASDPQPAAPVHGRG